MSGARLAGTALVVAAGLALAACSAETEPATDLGDDTATLHGVFRWEAGDGPGEFWWEYRELGGAWREQGRTPFPKVTEAGSVSIPMRLTGLTPATTYEYRICGRVDSHPATACFDKDGSGSAGAWDRFTTLEAGCDRTAADRSTLDSQVAAAVAGDRICLRTADYGTWTGTDKAVTVKPHTGATPSMRLNIESGDGNFTLDGLTIRGGNLTGGGSTGPHDLTIRNSRFTVQLGIFGVTQANILLERNTHVGIDVAEGAPPPEGLPGRITLSYQPFFQTHSGVTIRDSVFAGGEADGVQAGAGVNIVGNEFRDICYAADYRPGTNETNHADNVQIVNGARGTVVSRNFIHATQPCKQHGISAWSGSERVTIEDNVLDVHAWQALVLFSDDSSVVRHNTLRYRAPGCDPLIVLKEPVWGPTVPCGVIELGRLSGSSPPQSYDPGFGTIVVDNVATHIGVKNGSTAAQRHHNLVRGGSGAYAPDPADIVGTPTFVGGADPATYAGFRLAAGSPGKGAASDGLDIGIR